MTIDRGAETDRGRIVRNVVANAVRVGSAGGVSIVLPIVLVLILARTQYTAWAFCFAISVYVMYFDVGVPTSAQALVATAHVLDDRRRIREAMRAALLVSASVGVVLLAVSAGLAVMLGRVAPQMPVAIRTDASWCLVILVLGQVAELIALTATGYYAGLQRNSVPAAIIAPAQLVALTATLIAAALGAALPLMAACYSVPMVGSCLALVALVLLETKPDHKQASAQEAEVGERYRVSHLMRHSGPLVVWNLSTLAALGLGSLIVGHYAYHDVVPYSLASTMGAGLSGLIGALAVPLLPEFARVRQHAPRTLGRKILLSARLNSAALYVAAAALVALIPWYTALLVGSSLADRTQTWLTFTLVVTGTAVHLSGMPASLAFIAANVHRRMLLPPIIQAVTSVGVSLALVAALGAAGVACGILVGASAGIITLCFWSLARSGLADLQGRTLFRWSAAIPLIGFLPPVAALVITEIAGDPRKIPSVVAVCIGVALTAAWQLLVVVPRAERARMLVRLGR